MKAGESGTPGEVECDSSSCDDEEKPDAKQCAKTVDCGTLDTDISIVNRDSHDLLLLHHHHILFSIATVATIVL